MPLITSKGSNSDPPSLRSHISHLLRWRMGQGKEQLPNLSFGFPSYLNKLWFDLLVNIIKLPTIEKYWKWYDIQKVKFAQLSLRTIMQTVFILTEVHSIFPEIYKIWVVSRWNQTRIVLQVIKTKRVWVPIFQNKLILYSICDFEL